ncbi:MAG: CPBP family intramembrane metalloprotease [Elusimicrobia bacterium]|nr:CPBP family intramembrane metalloprotease [Elusimicrobiota bacterium]
MIAVMTLGEELGWRAFLQPRLIERFGSRRGLVLTGLIWGYWHFPLILMGYDFPGYPVSGAFVLMPLMSLGMACFIGWLYLKTKSIWVPALAHASNNAAGGLLLNLRSASGGLPIYVVCAAAWLAVGFACLHSLREDRRS